MPTYATLSLGTRQDAATWNKGCEARGFGQSVSIRKPKPTLAEISSVFTSSADWLYFGGHYSGGTLYNEDETVRLGFEADRVEVKIDGTEHEIGKNVSDSVFNLDMSSLVILWGGCSVCSGSGSIMAMRKLFGPHTLLGFVGSTGWEIVDAMLGAGFLKKGHFFDNLGVGIPTADKAAEAWMAAAKAGYGGVPMESKFRAIDMSGQEFKLESGEIVEGRKFQ